MPPQPTQSGQHYEQKQYRQPIAHAVTAAGRSFFQNRHGDNLTSTARKPSAKVVSPAHCSRSSRSL